MARVAGDLAGLAATPERLAALQRDLLVPLELQALAGRAEFPPAQVPSATCEASFPSPARRTARSAHQHDDRQVTINSGTGESAVNTST